MNSSFKKKKETNMPLKYIDLFAGTGAFSWVLNQHGLECVLANDMVASSEKIFKTNFPEKPFVLGDLLDISPNMIPSHDIVCAGFSCQPFSIAGKQEGFQDARSNVFWKLLEIIEHHQPCLLLLENVKNLLSHDRGKTFELILNRLQKLGYVVKYQVLDTARITQIPQHRERVYLVCFRHVHQAELFDFDFGEQQQSQPICQFLEKNVPNKYYYKDNLKVYDVIKKHVVKPVTTNTLYQYRRYYVRENKNHQCPTLTANMGSGGHNVPLLLDQKGIRKLTPRECFNLQGFPSTYQLPTTLSDSALYHLAGNAVSIPVVEKLISKVLMAIQHP